MDKSVIFYQASKQIINISKGIEENIKLKNSVPNWIKDPLKLLIESSEKYN